MLCLFLNFKTTKGFFCFKYHDFQVAQRDLAPKRLWIFVSFWVKFNVLMILFL